MYIVQCIALRPIDQKLKIESASVFCTQFQLAIWRTPSDQLRATLVKCTPHRTLYARHTKFISDSYLCQFNTHLIEIHMTKQSRLDAFGSRPLYRHVNPAHLQRTLFFASIRIYLSAMIQSNTDSSIWIEERMPFTTRACLYCIFICWPSLRSVHSRAHGIW